MKADKRQKPFWSFTHLDMTEQVSVAMPIARQLIRDGITSDPHPGENLTTRVLDLIAQNRGSHAVLVHLDDTEEGGAALFEALSAARAIGMALGLLLRPGAFPTRPSRVRRAGPGGARSAAASRSRSMHPRDAKKERAR